MQTLVLLSLFAVCSHALHATRPIVSKSIAPADQLRPRAQAKLCHGIDKKNECVQKACAYCKGKAKGVAEGCYHALETLRMPKNVFGCTGSKSVMEAVKLKAGKRNPSDPCEGKDQAKCDDLAECTWCKSAAVPSSCYTRAQAKFLPPAVFKCDKPPTTSAGHRRSGAGPADADKKAVLAGSTKAKSAGKSTTA